MDYTVETEVVEVLIDTWWNVNHGCTVITTAAVAVLIDTWWNVNLVETTL